MTPNLCFSEDISCSACCGLHNINLNQNNKIKLLEHHTKLFLKLDLLNRPMVMSFRNDLEEFYRKNMIRSDVYICPFLGFYKSESRITGCLLHPQGSPHPQISLLESPRQFSFYGEVICSTYDCISKQQIHQINTLILPIKKFIVEGNLTGKSLTFSKLAANHNLMEVCNQIIKITNPDPSKFWSYVLKELESTEIPVTSFEMPLTLDFFNPDELWHVLGMLFTDKGYLFDAFEITESGKNKGLQIRNQCK